MTEPNDVPPGISPLTREALGWVVRLRSGDATKADVEDVKLWRARSPQHEEAFREAALLWRDLKQTADEITVARNPRGARLAMSRTTRRALIGGAIAASVAGYLVYAPPLKLWPSLDELRADHRTAKGERREIAVADGVAVTLNTLSSLSILSAEPHNPRIQLVAGEASVIAARPVDRPVILQALDVRILASRAVFNARCIDGRVSVTCLEGGVDVEHGAVLVALGPGQEVDFAGDGLGSPVVADVEQAASWQQGLLIFHDRPLAAVVEEVNRYRPGRIVITNGELGRRLINGTFHLDRLDLFPGQVQQLFGATVRELPGGVVLLS